MFPKFFWWQACASNTCCINFEIARILKSLSEVVYLCRCSSCCAATDGTGSQSGLWGWLRTCTAAVISFQFKVFFITDLLDVGEDHWLYVVNMSFLFVTLRMNMVHRFASASMLPTLGTMIQRACTAENKYVWEREQQGKDRKMSQVDICRCYRLSIGLEILWNTLVFVISNVDLVENLSQLPIFFIWFNSGQLLLLKTFWVSFQVCTRSLWEASNTASTASIWVFTIIGSSSSTKFLWLSLPWSPFKLS
jgi:hypothetical protein